ncbi:ATP-binding protein [Pseudomonas sp. dw_358]|uniref:hybrid sensor histidine kinase/response regulator n=1 Tax=Pseudomonas sp. dw_358 TaxID=2720083 RepID=UPI0031F6F51E
MTLPGTQRIAKIRRDYNRWVADESMEDYALRYAPSSFRRWSEGRIVNTALSSVSFLVLEAIGGTLVMNYGFTNTFWAVLAVALIILLTGLPISYYAARYGVDMDLLTRGAGFGYIGSTITSLIYASFTFLFFALEAAIMALALELYFHIPLAWGYVLCSVIIIPLVAYGFTLISRLQMWSQPLWLGLLIVPYGFILWKSPDTLSDFTSFAGRHGEAGTFDLLLFGAALSVVLSLVTQIGEQVDYIRFLPQRTADNNLRWWTALLLAGPGWIVPGALKLMAGAFLAFLAIEHEVPVGRAVEPTQMYLVAYSYVFRSPEWAMAAMALLVVISQMKINLTNAYAGSLAWSNFFARMTHSHPGRVVWLVFNVGIALLLMEMGIFDAIGEVLGLYANLAIAWIGALVADLVINKPLGLSPPYIEFKRAHLYDVNPVGVGAMGVASLVSLLAHFGAFGSLAQAAPPLLALITALVTSPLIAWLTAGRYYLARQSDSQLLYPTGATATVTCGVCSNAFERPDMAWCPAYASPICSLCCSLEVRCGDQCKPRSRLLMQVEDWLARLLPQSFSRNLHTRLAHYMGILAVLIALLSGALALVYTQVTHNLAQESWQTQHTLTLAFIKAFMALCVFAAVLAWWVVLTRESRHVAQEESERQTALLMQEIEAHEQTDLALQRAKEASEAANAAKSRYITGLSHELRTPLNSILGYTQILQRDASTPPRQQEGLATILRNSSHLLSLIDGLLDVAKIEAGKLRLELSEIAFLDFIQDLERLFAPAARDKGLDFRLQIIGDLPPVVRGDEKRIRQILINLLGNAVNFTDSGEVCLRVSYRRQTATLEIIDSGIGIAEDQLERIFQPFERGDTDRQDKGVGLGLTITRMLTALMGGELSVSSVPGGGSRFQVRLYLSQVRVPKAIIHADHDLIGYEGPPRLVLVVDDHIEHRNVISGMLVPLGFNVAQAANGQEAIRQVSLLKPDLILMDLSMPHMDGWETSRLIRRNVHCLTPIVVVSAHANALVDERAENGLVNIDYLAKPVHLQHLLDRIQHHLQLTWSRRAAVAPVNAPPAQALARGDLELLKELCADGDIISVQQQLSRMAEHGPDSVIAHLRALAKGFRLAELERTLTESLND